MKITHIIKLALLSMTITLSLQVQAEVVGSVILKLKVEAEKEVYRLESKRSKRYALTRGGQKITIAITGTGAFRELNTSSVDEVPYNTDASEHGQTVRLRATEGRVYLDYNSPNAIGKDNGELAPFSFSVTPLVHKGSWSEYVNDGLLKMVLLPDDQFRFVEIIEQELRNSLIPKLMQQLSGYDLELSDIVLTSMESHGPTWITAIQNQLTIESVGQTYMFKIDVSSRE